MQEFPQHTPFGLWRRITVRGVKIGGETMRGFLVASAVGGFALIFSVSAAGGLGPPDVCLPDPPRPPFVPIPYPNIAMQAHLNGAGQVPPFDTLAQGQFTAMLCGGDLSYRLTVANLANIVAAHIHCGEVDVNGPVGVTLFAGAPVTLSGTLAEGPILAPDSSNGCSWLDLDDVIDALESGATYVNVHTLQSLPGEIRGQVKWELP